MKHGSCRETKVPMRTLGGPSGWLAARTQMAQANSGENEQPAQRCPLPRAWGNDWAEAHYNGRDAALVAICERVAHCEPCSRSRYSCHPYPAEPVAVTHARAINSSLCIQNSRRKGERGRGLFSELLVLCPRARRQRAAIHHVATITRMDAILIRWSLLRHLRKQ